ncbi:uncharacterized protein [Leptinotarsa decemlineata]|uniref:uncharacterized protein n=1 Tax=Leptinotarsa decemlineata TaxID=7539 RepID=UPI003D309E2D
MPLKILQINVDRRGAAQKLLAKTIEGEGVDIALVQEPNIRMTSNNPRWILDSTSTCAVFCANPGCGVVTHVKGQGFVCIKFEDWTLYSCYISPNISMEVYKERLHLILDHVADSKNEAIVAGDFNAKSPSWNSPITDARGTYMDEALQALDMVVLNEGSTPTFTRGATASYIDVTFATQKTSRLVHSWRVSTGESLSLHRHIFYDIIREM